MQFTSWDDVDENMTSDVYVKSIFSYKYIDVD